MESNKTMKKLDDIPRKNPYSVPDGYFERLPGIVQARLTAERPSTLYFRWSVSVKLAVAGLVLCALGLFWYNSAPWSPADVQAQLGAISPDQLVRFLEDQDVTTDELVERVAWSNEDLNNLENSVYSGLEEPKTDVDQMMNEIDNEL